MSIELTSAQIAEMLNGKLLGPEDIRIRGVAKIEEAESDQLAFVANVKYTKYLNSTRAGLILVSPGMSTSKAAVIELEDPYTGFIRMIEYFHPKKARPSPGIHPTTVVETSAEIGKDVSIGPFCSIGSNAVIGDRTVIHPHVIVDPGVEIGKDCEIFSHVNLREDTKLGNRVIVQNGAVIGSDGFGFAPGEDGYRKIPQVGRVVIEDGVEIGANTTIDRATLGETIIRSGTKLDNLIQVGHNVVIGRQTVIAAQSGISGSTKVGDRCMIGGQVGLVGHLNIGDRVMIAAQSGLSNDVKAGEIVSGSPARPIQVWRRIEAALNRLPELIKRVRRLEEHSDSGTKQNQTKTS